MYFISVFLFVAGKWWLSSLTVAFSAVPGFPGTRQLCVISDVIRRDCPKEGKYFSLNNYFLFDLIAELAVERILGSREACIYAF